MNVNLLYMPLADSQINQIKAMIDSMALKPLLISKQQILAVSEVPTEKFIQMPLNADQVKQLNYCMATKSDITLEFNFHQIQMIAKNNFDLDVDIRHHVLSHMSKPRIHKDYFN